MCWVIPPYSCDATLVLRMASSRLVLPWSTCPITVTTGGLVVCHCSPGSAAGVSRVGASSVTSTRSGARGANLSAAITRPAITSGFRGDRRRRRLRRNAWRSRFPAGFGLIARGLPNIREANGRLLLRGGPRRRGGRLSRGRRRGGRRVLFHRPVHVGGLRVRDRFLDLGPDL